MTQFTHKRLQQSFRSAGVIRSVDQLFQILLDAHNEPHRFYHNTQHISDCLQQLETHHALTQEPAMIELAIWFHDVIYDTHRNDNEEKSAAFACKHLRDCQFSDEKIGRVEALILATKHNATPDSFDTQLLIDIDLSILGQTPERFDQYDQQVRQEYAWVDAEIFRKGRKEVLQSFFEKQRLYCTEIYYSQLEESAKNNLERAILRLQPNQTDL